MIAYFKQRKSQLMESREGSSNENGNAELEENDVLKDKTGMAKCMENYEIQGMDKGVLKDC